MARLKDTFDDVAPPEDLPRSDAVRVFHGERVADPYQYLDRGVTPPVQSWINALEAEYQRFIGDPSTRKKTEDFLNDAAARDVKGIPQKVGEQYLFYYRGADEKQTKLMISDTAEGEGRVLVDPGKQEFRNAYVSPDGKNLLYVLKDPGNWTGKLHILDLETGKQLSENMPAAAVWWDKEGKGFHYNAQVPGEPSRVVMRHHTLGDKGADPVVEDGVNFAYDFFRGHSAYDGAQEWRFTSMGTGQNDLKPGIEMRDPATGAFRMLFKPGAVDAYPIADRGDGILFWTTEGAPKGRVVLVDPEKPAPENWQTVIPEDSKAALQHVFTHQGKLMAVYNHNAAEEMRVFGKDGGYIATAPLPPAQLNFAHASNAGRSLGMGAPASDDLFFEATTFTGPPQVYRYDVKTNNVAPLDPKPPGPDLSDCIVEQIWATSKDGTKVPMTVVRRKDVALDGTAALKLEGYGGFGSAQMPHHTPEMLDFVRSGGIYVQANVRGGGEFGLGWHEGGRGLNKQNSFDDINACAEELIAQNYTSAKRIVSEGHSNGGLLVLEAMLQRPELYGAVISSAPVADLLGKNQVREYGDPEKDKRDFGNLKTISPLENIRAGVKYPPLQIRTSEKDWLLPQALKFIAAFRHANPDSTALLHYEAGYGHESTRPPGVEASEAAGKRAFIERSIGPLDQDAYKKTLQPGAARTRSPALSGT